MKATVSGHTFECRNEINSIIYSCQPWYMHAYTELPVLEHAFMERKIISFIRILLRIPFLRLTVQIFYSTLLERMPTYRKTKAVKGHFFGLPCLRLNLQNGKNIRIFYDGWSRDNIVNTLN